MPLVVSSVVRTFGLSPAQSKQLQLLARDKARSKVVEALHKAAIAAPSALETMKAQVLAELVKPASQPTTTAPSAPTAPTSPAAPTPPPTIAWVIGQDGKPAAYVVGQPIAPGALVCYAGQEQSATPWVAYAPTAPVVHQPAAPTPPAETRLTVEPATIPQSSASGGKYKLPWVLGANRGQDGTIYAQFGYQNGKSFNRASVNLAELLEALADSNVSALRATLVDLQSRLGG